MTYERRGRMTIHSSPLWTMTENGKRKEEERDTVCTE